jgi:hypothetical protein
MASTNWAATIRWAQQRGQADATFIALLAGAKVYAPTIPQTLSIAAKPGAVIGLQSTAPPRGPLRSGANTYESQEIIWRLQLRQKTQSTLALEAAAARALVLYDGAYYNSVTGGMVYQTLYVSTAEVIDGVGDEQVILWNLLFQSYAKAV